MGRFPRLTPVRPDSRSPSAGTHNCHSVCVRCDRSCVKIPRFCCSYFRLMCACVCATLRVKIPRFHCSYSWLMCSEFSLENEVLKPFFLTGIFGCPTVRKFREFVAAVAGLLLFVVVCLSLSGVSFIYFLRRAWVYSCFVLCCVWATACTCMRLLGERG